MRFAVGVVGALALGLGGSTATAATLAVPSEVAARATSTSSVLLTWSDSNAVLTEFVVQRSSKPDNGFKTIASPAATARSWGDTGLAAGATYYYRMRAKQNGTVSQLSSTASVTTPTTNADGTPPPVPTGVRIGTVECRRIDVFWPPVVDTGGSGLRGYKVYRNGALFREILTPGISITDLTVAPSSGYTYGIAASDNAGNESAQHMISQSTPACAVSATTTPVRTATPIRTSTATATPVRTSTAIRTSTPVRTATRTATPIQTTTPMRTATPVPTTTPVPTDGPWAKRFGGTGFDAARAVAIDGRGDVVVTGSFTGTTNFGGGALSTAGGSDVVLAKYTATGAHVWSHRMGSIGLDQGVGVAIDRSANCDGAGGTNCVVVAGSFGYTADFDPGPGTAALTTAGAGDVFVAKYSSAGTYLWARRFGANNTTTNDILSGVAVDSRANCDGVGGSGCVLFIGSVYERADFDGLMLAGPAGVMTPFVAKYSGGGTRVWAKTFGNNNEAFGRAIAVGADGNVAITGSFKGSMNFGNGTKSSFGGDDVFVAVLRGADGGGIWSSRHGSDGQDAGFGIALDRAGNVALTGSSSSMNGGISFGGATWYSTGTDIFVASLGANGTHRWSRRCTGTYTAMRQGTSVATDDDGNVLLAGHFYGSLNCGTDTGTLTAAGYADILTAKFGPNGAYLWMDRYGRMGCADSGTGIAVDPSGDQVMSTGLFQGQVDIEGHLLPSAGLDDVFVMRVLP